MKPLIITCFLLGAYLAFCQTQKNLQQKYDQLQTRYNTMKDTLTAMIKEIESTLR